MSTSYYLVMVFAAFAPIVWTLDRNAGQLRRTVAHPGQIMLGLAALLALAWPIGLPWAVYTQARQLAATRRQS